MTEMQVVFETAAVQAKLERLIFALQPMSMLAWMKDVVEPFLQQRATERFAGEGDDASGRWAPLTEATISFRTAGQIDYGAGPINHRTGALEEYITSSDGGYVTEGGDSVMIYPGVAPTGSNETGTLLDKLTAAQQGLASPYTPARPVLAISEKDLAFVLTGLELYVMGV